MTLTDVSGTLEDDWKEVLISSRGTFTAGLAGTSATRTDLVVGISPLQELAGASADDWSCSWHLECSLIFKCMVHMMLIEVLWARGFPDDESSQLRSYFTQNWVIRVAAWWWLEGFSSCSSTAGHAPESWGVPHQTNLSLEYRPSSKPHHLISCKILSMDSFLENGRCPKW